jgi:predicted secreted acid phosphatase
MFRFEGRSSKTLFLGPMFYDFKNIFAEKKSAKKLAFLTQNKAKLCKMLIITLDFEKNANFFAENWQKSQKIVIITSTPGLGP